MIAQAIRAISLASATAATFVGRRSIIRVMPSSLGAVLSCVANDRHGAGDEQPLQIAIALLGDTAEPFLAAGRVLLGHQTDPSGKIAPRAEGAPVADLRNQGRGDDRTNAGDLLEPSARFAGSVPSMDTHIDRCDLGICNDLPGNQLGGGKLDRSLVGPLSVCRERSDYRGNSLVN